MSQFAEVVRHQLMLLRLRLTRGAVLVTGMDISYSSNYPQWRAVLTTAGLPTAAQPAQGTALLAVPVVETA